MRTGGKGRIPSFRRELSCIQTILNTGVSNSTLYFAAIFALALRMTPGRCRANEMRVGAYSSAFAQMRGAGKPSATLLPQQSARVMSGAPLVRISTPLVGLGLNGLVLKP